MQLEGVFLGLVSLQGGDGLELVEGQLVLVNPKETVLVAEQEPVCLKVSDFLAELDVLGTDVTDEFGVIIIFVCCFKDTYLKQSRLLNSPVSTEHLYHLSIDIFNPGLQCLHCLSDPCLFSL